MDSPWLVMMIGLRLAVDTPWIGTIYRMSNHYHFSEQVTLNTDGQREENILRLFALMFKLVKNAFGRERVGSGNDVACAVSLSGLIH